MPFKPFSDFETEGANWITLATGEYYPDILKDACILYQPVIALFGHLLERCANSTELFTRIAETKEGWTRVQLARVFKRYVSPPTPVEMLKVKSNAPKIIAEFGDGFRAIAVVQKKFKERPQPDEALSALLWEYKDRGKKGYDLTEKFFAIFRTQFHDKLIIKGPERAGQDINLAHVFPDYSKFNRDRPVDFVLYNPSGEPVAIGLARYDGDRGGAQEDDRTGGYNACASEIFEYAKTKDLHRLKVIFLNDGPGLLLGTMWRDYSRLEEKWGGKVMITTLRMVPERITLAWLELEVR
jgi:hypothetical protein